MPQLLLWTLVNGFKAADKPLCKDEGQWCNPTNYPETKVERILSNNKKIVNFLDKDNDVFVELRSFDPYYENVCNERTEYIYPRAAKNKEENWMFIVNSPQNDTRYRQMVKITKCTNPGFACASGEVFTSRTKCVQEYSDHKLVALSEAGDDLIVDTFSFPSCCL